MVKNQKLREAQLLEFNLLKKFKEICNSEGMKYYLLGGTAIGAIRHKGFIPWDDDIDVALMREDYDKFIKIADKYLEPEQKILHYSLDNSYQDYTLKIIDMNTVFVTQQENKITEKNIWIDIFPIDGTPNNKLMRWIHYKRLDYLRMQLAFHYINELRIDEQRSWWKRVLVNFAKISRIGKLINPSRVKADIDNEFNKYSVEDSKYIGNYMGAYHEREFFPKEYFGIGAEVSFEGEKFLAPFEIDKYLKHQYGEYMKLPPENQQVPKHYVLDVIHKNK